MRFERDLMRGSEQRLWELIEARTKVGSNTEDIDRRIWDLFGEEWAIVFTDLAGFSRRTESFGIIHFLQVIFEQKQLLLPIIADFDGVLVKSEADSLLLLFRRANRALQCAIEMQRACQNASERRVPEEQILLCVGIGSGKILRIGDHDVWGSEVNAASKLGEDTAAAHEILITRAAMEHAGQVLGIEYQDLETPVPGSKQNYRVGYKR